MIAGIEGTVEKKEPTVLYINTGGLIYEVFVSVNCSSAVQGPKVRLHTTHIIREDAQQLYGFLDPNEKRMFDTLIKISGIGPKVAMAVCSTFLPSTFLKIIESKDAEMLRRVPGIGPKGASRILVELGGFSVDLVLPKEEGLHRQAAMALESLGFKKDEVAKILPSCSGGDTGEIVKEALRKLQKL